MQPCSTISEDLSAYLDGELPPQERAGVEAHLNTCAACKAEYESLVNAHAAMASLKKMNAPNSLREKVNAQLVAQTPRVNELSRHRARFSWAMLATSLAATVLVALLGFHYFYNPPSNVAENRKTTGTTTIAKTSPGETQQSTNSTASTRAGAERDNASLRTRKRLIDPLENSEAAAKRSEAVKDEDLKKSGAGDDANRALNKDARLQSEKSKSAAAQPSPIRRGEAQDRSARAPKKEEAGEAEGLRDAPPAKSADANARQLDDKMVLEQRQYPVPRAESKTEQQQTQNAPAPVKPSLKAPVVVREKIAADGASKTNGLPVNGAAPLAPASPSEKPAATTKAGALNPAEKKQDSAALEQTKEKKEAAKDAPTAPAEPVASLESRKDALAETEKKLDAKTAPKQAATETKPANDPAKGAEFDFADSAQKSPATPAVGFGAGGGAGAVRRPQGAADSVITLRTRDTDATLAKLKALAQARQATLVPAQTLEAPTDKATSAAAAKLATATQSEFVFTVSADQAAALRQDLDALQEYRDAERAAQKPSEAAVAAPLAPAKKAENETIIIRVIIENDLKK